MMSDSRKQYRSALAFLLCNSLLRKEMLPFQKALMPSSGGVDEVIQAIDSLASEILEFFCDADSYRDSWSPPETDFGVFAGRHEEAIFSISIDDEERECIKAAEEHNLKPLTDFIKRNGVLRTSAGREFVANAISRKLPRSIATKNNRQEVLFEIILIQCKRNCSEYEAKLNLARFKPRRAK